MHLMEQCEHHLWLLASLACLLRKRSRPNSTTPGSSMTELKATAPVCILR